MAPPLLTLQDIALTFGTAPLLAGAGIAVSAGDRVCLVGRNGSGKSTLLRIAAGLIQPDAGRRFVQPGAGTRQPPLRHRRDLARSAAGGHPARQAALIESRPPGPGRAGRAPSAAMGASAMNFQVFVPGLDR
jgi:ATPase subunit of ABC transporter with duplicated ATPase domains